MKKYFIYLPPIALLMLVGCPRRKSVSQIAETSSQVAQKTIESVASYNPSSLYSVVGLIIILAGICIAFFINKAQGCSLILCGAGVAYFGQILATQPIVCLIAVILMQIVLGLIAYSYWKEKNDHASTNKNLEKTAVALKETVAVIQNHPEIKPEIGDGIPSVQEQIRPIISQTKIILKEEGRI